MIQRYEPYVPPALPGSARIPDMIPVEGGRWVTYADACKMAHGTGLGLVARLADRAQRQPRLVSRDSFVRWLRGALP